VRKVVDESNFFRGASIGLLMIDSRILFIAQEDPWLQFVQKVDQIGLHLMPNHLT
jgi:hypothetical protein